MRYTLKQASEATGKDRSTLLRAIKTGKLSAIRQDDKSYLIDAAELSRLFPLHMRTSENAQGLPRHAQAAAQGAQGLDVLLADREGRREREIRRLEETIVDLRSERDRLLRVIEGHAETVKQLTHQPTPSSTRQPPGTPTDGPQEGHWWQVREWLWVSLAVSLVLLAVVYWYTGYLQRIGLEGWQ
jgi:hypothetical protein